MKANSKRLHRSKSDSMVFGVSGGLAEYFDVDPSLMRIAWVVAILASGGVALLAYIILAIVVPKEESRAAEPSEVVRENLGDLPADAAEAGNALGITSDEEDTGRGKRGRTLAGIVLVAVGAVFLLSNLGVLSWWRWDVFWPVLLIGVGAALLVGRLWKRDDV